MTVSIAVGYATNGRLALTRPGKGGNRMRCVGGAGLVMPCGVPGLKSQSGSSPRADRVRDFSVSDDLGPWG